MKVMGGTRRKNASQSGELDAEQALARQQAEYKKAQIKLRQRKVR